MSAHSTERNAERLLQLSDEVGRIAATFAGLSPEPATPDLDTAAGSPGEAPEISIERVRAAIRARRLRTNHFAEELFAEPAWDMMLYLLQSELSHRRVSVSSLCVAAAVPTTTGLRWLKSMVDRGLFVRRSDPLDGRRIFVELAPEASASLRAYFAETNGLPLS
jgi:DNA-binding MarR family transcriptional regulator